MKNASICIIASQILNKEKIGGFGSMTYQLARHLKRKGWSVKLLIPKRRHDPDHDSIEEIPVRFFSKKEMFQKSLYKQLDVDIFHSQNQTIASSMARFYCPEAKHIVTCRDPRSTSDWINEFQNATFYRKLKTPISYLTEESILATWAIKKADQVACPANFLIPKIRKMYGLKHDPIFLPNLEEIPDSLPDKSKMPTVCWVGRFAKRKNPERYLKLAETFPAVRFIIAGNAEEEKRQQYLESWMDRLENVQYLGFKDKFNDPEFYDMYDKAWILCNTSTREGLPLTFVEAAGRGCAILSYVNPDNFTSDFGYWAKSDDYEAGLAFLIEDSRSKKKGEMAHEYCKNVYGVEHALKKHEELYIQLHSAKKV